MRAQTRMLKWLFRIFCCKINFELVLKRLKKDDKRRTTVMIWCLKAYKIWIFNWPFTIDNFGWIEIIQADIKTNYRSQPYSPLQNKSILFVPSQFPLHCLCFLSSFAWQRSDTTPCHTVGSGNPFRSFRFKYRCFVWLWWDEGWRHMTTFQSYE